MAYTTKELLQIAFGTGRVPNAGGRPGKGDKPSRKTGTPKAARGSAQSSNYGSRTASRDVSDDEADDDASIASDEGWMTYDLGDMKSSNDNGAEDEAAGSAISDWETQLNDALDSLAEKRGVSREKVLASVVRILSHVHAGDGFEGNSLTCLEALRKCVRTAKSTLEAQLAIRGVSLWFISFGVDADPEDYNSVSDQLKAIALDREGRTAAVRAVAVGALGMANFVAGADHNDAAQLMDEVVHKLILEPALVSGEVKEDAAVVRQALETYGFLMTVVIDGDAGLADQLFETAFEAHIRALGADDVNVCLAAAQNFALVHSSLARENSDFDNPHGNAASHRASDKASQERIQSPAFEFERQEELVATLRMLSHQSSKKQGRRHMLVQRSMMRDILRTIEIGETPNFKFLFNKKTIRFDDWTRIVRLHTFKTVLGDGMPAHFAENPMLQDVFQTDSVIGAKEDSDDEDGRVVVDPSSAKAKARTISLQKRRKDAYAAKHQMDDGY
ncbi:Interferon- developmental regulator 1 [Coemansia sp. RSA 1939]|nr:Interferon- developmental regulator 1 [Coemansia sp. RSA 1939]